VLGGALGAYLVGFSVDSLSAIFSGWTLPYSVPWGIAAGSSRSSARHDCGGAVPRARVALSVSPAEALEFE